MVRRMWFVVVVAAVSMLSGCFQIKTDIILHTNGSAVISQHLQLSTGMVEALAEISRLNPEAVEQLDHMKTKLLAFGKSDKKKLKRKGITVKKHNVLFDDENFLIEWTTSLKSFDSAPLLGMLSGSDELNTSLIDNGDNTSTISWSGATPEPQDEDKPETPQLTEEQQAKLVAASMKMMGEASNLSMETQITTPGEVVSYSPKTGATVDGNTVTWTIDSTSIAAMGTETEGSGAFKVTYKTD